MRVLYQLLLDLMKTKGILTMTRAFVKEGNQAVLPRLIRQLLSIATYGYTCLTKL